ncbi:MAG: hypothetical protein ABR592_05680 [Nitriliruptorales bacterium]
MPGLGLPELVLLVVPLVILLLLIWWLVRAVGASRARHAQVVERLERIESELRGRGGHSGGSRT